MSTETSKSARGSAPPPVEPRIDDAAGFRSGWVALVGRPNVGKSTLLNELLGQKIAATTNKPQTTRRNLLGMLHPPGAQVLLLDTPGHHKAKGPLNRFMVAQVREAVRDADVVAYLVEARTDGRVTPGNERLIEELKATKKPIVVLVNKIDQLENPNLMLPQLQALQEVFGAQAAAIVPLSAVKRDGLEQVVRALAAALPVGEPYFESGQMTDASERAIVAELIREKVMLETKDELPYATAVAVDNFEDFRPGLVRIMATIHVERDSQKPILIGKGGERIKAIGQRARKEIERLVESKVHLELFVRVSAKWTERPRVLSDLGYGTRGGHA